MTQIFVALTFIQRQFQIWSRLTDKNVRNHRIERSFARILRNDTFLSYPPSASCRELIRFALGRDAEGCLTSSWASLLTAAEREREGFASASQQRMRGSVLLQRVIGHTLAERVSLMGNLTNPLTR
jgi:hypothetical protein